MNKKSYKDILNDIKNTSKKTKDIDLYNKKLIKNGTNVSDLKNHIIQDQSVYRTYFQVSLGNLNSLQSQIEFIEENEDFLQDWWHVDELPQFLKKPLKFDFIYKKAQKYINSDKIFVRRWGYVIFLTGLQKDKSNTQKILKLIKNDDEYYVQMAEAWLIADLAVYNIKEVKSFIKTSKIKYNILGKAIQKICDSYRIKDIDKEYFKSLRNQLKYNK